MAIVQLDIPTQLDPGGWVDAAPFRAHLRHLMAAGDVSVGVVAQLAGVSPRIAKHLLHGRAGRAVRRISPDVGRKLLRVSATEVRTIEYRVVPAANTSRRLRRLLAVGWTYPDLSELLGVRPADIAAIIDEQVTTCPQMIALRVAAATFQISSRSDLRYRLPRALSAAA